MKLKQIASIILLEDNNHASQYMSNKKRKRSTAEADEVG